MGAFLQFCNLFLFLLYIGLLLKIFGSDVDEYGFKRPEDFDYTSYEKIMSVYYTVLANRRRQWERFMAKKPNLHNNRSGQLKRYIRKGIPGNVKKLLVNVLHQDMISALFLPKYYCMCRSSFVSTLENARFLSDFV